MSKLTLLTLPPSPHNTKVRLALKLKGLAFDTIEVGFADRDEVIARSGQPLTPVLLDGDRVVYDSFGIVRYLDANWPEPRLFAATRDGQRAIQTWERFAVDEVGSTLAMLLQGFLAGTDDPAVNARVQARFNELPQRVESALSEAPYLGGDRPNAADLTVAPFFRFAVTDPTTLSEGSPARFAAERCDLAPEFAATRAWIARVMEIDAVEPART